MKTRTIVIGIVLACCGLFVVLVAACAGLFYSMFRNMDTTVSPKIDTLLAAVDNGTFGDTYEAETTPELKQATTKKEWTQLGQAIKTRLGSLKTKELKQFNVRQFNTEQTADVVYSATFEKGSGEIRARLKSIGGDWRFVSFHVSSPEFLNALSALECPHCGDACPADAKFCSKCGKAMTGRDESKPVAKDRGKRGTDSTTKKKSP